MVGMTRFERATPSSQARCSTKLSHIPKNLDGSTNFNLIINKIGCQGFLAEKLKGLKAE